MKKTSLIITVFLFSISATSSAQVAFQMRYVSNDQLLLPMLLPYSSGYYLSGQYYDTTLTLRDITVMRTNSNGIQQWTKAYDSQLFDVINDWYVNPDGSLVMAGNIDTTQGVDGNALIMKVDSNGNFLWATAFGGTGHDWATGVVRTRDGGTVAVCNTYSFNVQHEQMYLVKLDSAGNKIWSRVIGDTILFHSYSLKETFDGGFVLTGEITPPYSMVLIKTDSMGIPEWRKDYDSNIEDWAFNVFQNSDSGYTVYGTTNDGDYPTIIRTDKTGNIIWTQRYMGPVSTLISIRNCALSQDGSFLFSGYLLDSAFQQRFYLTRVDSLGQVLWTNVYDSTFNTFADSRFLELNDSSFLFAGYMVDSGTVLMQTNGNLSCVINSQPVFGSSISLTTDSGITYFTPVDTMWHPVLTARTITVTTDTLCYNDLTTGLNKEPESFSWNIYPNPFNTQLIIKSEKEIRQVELLDNLGRKIQDSHPNNFEHIIDTRNITNGVYYLKIKFDHTIILKAVFKN